MLALQNISLFQPLGFISHDITLFKLIFANFLLTENINPPPAVDRHSH